MAIALENALSYQRIEELNARLAEEKVYLEDEIRTDNRFEEIVGQSRVLKAVLKQVETVAPTDSTVLIYGETGTGKELLARAIHDLSPRRQGTFVKLNCAAIPTGLLESEMFGHEKGAFTGAIAQRIGRFELAHRGTMFLDEVGEIPLELQTKLLRVLQEREFERLGSSRTIRTDARLVAATNRDLAALVEERQFRADLYYRLNVFPITVPPLRERRDDIPLLVRYFVQQYARRMNRRITNIPAGAMQALTRYHWPGNIRRAAELHRAGGDRFARPYPAGAGARAQRSARRRLGLRRGHPGRCRKRSYRARPPRCRRPRRRSARRRRQARHEAHHPAGQDAQTGDRGQGPAGLTSVAIGKTGRLNGRLSSDRRVFDPSPPFSLRCRSGDRFKILYHLTDGNSKLAIIDDAGEVLVLPTAHVPHIWPLEVTNALVKAPRRKHITQYELFDYARQLARLRALVDFDCTLERAFHELLTLAERRQLTTYNAAYPELAQRRGLPLATADGNLLQAAGATRVEVFKP